MCYQFLRKENTIFSLQNTLLDAFRTNSRNTIGRNPSMVIPMLANQDLTPMLMSTLVLVFIPGVEWKEDCITGSGGQRYMKCLSWKENKEKVLMLSVH